MIHTQQSLLADNHVLKYLPQPDHPNYKLWRNYVLFAVDRGRLVADILQSFMGLQGTNILDVGCGVGGASLALAERGALVTAIDKNVDRLAGLSALAKQQNLSVRTLAIPFKELKVKRDSFDAVILQDVLEHLSNPLHAMRRSAEVLKRRGFLYISTPNRWSPLNIVCDPHWNLPLVAILSRNNVRLVVAQLLKRVDRNKTDIAALPSFQQLWKLLTENGFEIQFVNRQVAEEMLKNPSCVLNSQWHLRVLEGMKKIGIAPLVTKIVNDGTGVFNRFFNPTWFLVAQKL